MSIRRVPGCFNFWPPSNNNFQSLLLKFRFENCSLGMNSSTQHLESQTALGVQMLKRYKHSTAWSDLLTGMCNEFLLVCHTVCPPGNREVPMVPQPKATEAGAGKGTGEGRGAASGQSRRGAGSAAGCSATPHSLSGFSSHTPIVLSHLDLVWVFFFHVSTVMSLITLFNKLLLTSLLVVSEQPVTVTAVCTSEDRCHALASLLFQIKHQIPSLLQLTFPKLLAVSVAIVLACLPTSFLRAFVMPETG